MRVPMSGLPIQHQALAKEILPRVLELVAAQTFVLGEPVLAFERTLARLTGAPEAVGVASGTDALVLSLRALGVGPGDAVVVPAFGFLASAGAVVLAGARPVFADVVGFSVEPERVEAVLSRSRARAVIAAHLFGECAPMGELLSVAARHGAVVVEDAAQAILATDAGRGAGSLGALGALSFFPSKNLGGWGDGGAVVGSGEALARVRRLRTHGMAQGKSVEVGTNSRLDALQAVVLEVKATHLEEWTSARERMARSYRDALSPFAEQVRLPPEPRVGCRHVYNQFVVRVPDPDSLARHLASRGIDSRRYYPRPLPEEPAFTCFAEGERFPGAEDASRAALGLPIYPELTLGQQGDVVGAVAEFFRGRL
jgi:dTDP-4-amino-4,6-dideoxygalactose transaminase